MTSSVTRLFLSALLFLSISASPASASDYHDCSLQLASSGYVRGQLTRATVGRGEVTTTEPATTSQSLNRDLDAFQTVTANRNTGGLNVDVTVDQRMLSKRGWGSIA
ncbi:MAG TPA: hypothetical protein ENJ80_11895, partial [Gammaproteobacteria bacterium]|nr:hypothetical protein [Gammaproteobacteria bacterium]